MKGLYTVAALLLFVLMLSACGQAQDQGDTSGGEETELAAIEVETDMPEKPEPGEEVELAASVTQGNEAVSDADEVRFEIWKDGSKSDSEEILSENREDNRYSISYTFEEEALYHVTAHVTARDMHNMPTADVTVGNPETNSSESDESAAGEGSEPFNITYQSEPAVVGEPSDLTFAVQHEGEALTGADVRYEIESEGEGSVVWLETEETGDGVYTGTHIFEAAGDYTLTLHAENEEGLHEHENTTITAEE
ncbi:FixH family protein [Salibacterium sp. K-3]